MEPNRDLPERAGEQMLAIALGLVDNLDAPLAYWDVNQVCLVANRAYAEWFGKARAELIGMTLEQLLGARHPLDQPQILGALRDGQTQVFERESEAPDGAIRYSLATYTPHVVAGQIRGMFVHLADVTPLKKLQAELEAARAQAESVATHDYLTGLPNRVLLLDRFKLALALAKRKEQMAAVISLDVDDFKRVNDTYGHAAGDQLLVEIASRLTSTLRTSDTVTRLRGDEFLLLAPEINTLAQVVTMAERLLDSTWQPFQLHPFTVSCTLSVGIAVFPRDGSSAEDLIAKSDRALKAAKQQGKNGYAFYSAAGASP